MEFTSPGSLGRGLANMAAGEHPPSPNTPDLIAEAEIEAVLEETDDEDEIVAATTEAVVKISSRKPGPELDEKRKTHNRTSKKWADREKQVLLLGQRALGAEASRWVLISKLMLPGRSATALSNLWRTERYQSEIQNQAAWTNVPDELQELVDQAVSTFRSKSSKTEAPTGAKTAELQQLPPAATVPSEIPDATSADGQVNANGIAATLSVTSSCNGSGATVAVPSAIVLPVPRKRKGSPTSTNRVIFASSAFGKKPPGSTLDSLLFSVPNLYPNLTMSEVNATTSVPTNCIVTKQMFARYDAQLRGDPAPPSLPRPNLHVPDAYHPLAYFRLPPLQLGQGVRPIQTQFDLCNPLDSLPFDQDLEDAFWCGEGRC